MSAPPPVDRGYAAEPLGIALAMDIDAEVRGTRREVDHTFWLAGSGEGGAV